MAAAIGDTKPTFIFVERGGASAAAAVSGIVGKLESDLGAHVSKVADLARREASAFHQADLDAAAVRQLSLRYSLL